VLGHPRNALAWLANKLGEHGKTLKKGMIVSSGSMVACQFVPPGSTATGKIEGLGEVTLKYELPK
jgi:2-oxo-hept-3-ene-1,7-dioate hydratase